MDFQLPEASLGLTSSSGCPFAASTFEPTYTETTPLASSSHTSSSVYTQRKLRIAIVSENLMPKVDGVTRCLARLLEHLREQGHEAVVLGPQSGMTHYETHPLVGTAGIPLVLYPGLKLNFLRPKFLRVIGEFNPDVVHVVEPIWLGAQVLLAMQLGWAGKEWMPEDRPGYPRGPGGAVVASYHTNLPTYATLFGFPWLEPIMWRFVRWLHGKCLLTACPSQSTADMLRSRGISTVRIWPRGVDLELFGPHRRSHMRRRTWGVAVNNSSLCVDNSNNNNESNSSKAGLLTPPPSPDLLPADEQQRRAESVVVLYVGRISFEKNLMLLVRAFEKVLQDLPSGSPRPCLVFVGDGPARKSIEQMCAEKGIDAVFEGHLSGEELAEAYASADIFAFPSFTETFGQVIVEALASCLPVVGLDAEGTKDIVHDGRTGYLLRKPEGSANAEWSTILASADSPTFASAAESYAALLLPLITDRKLQSTMRKRTRSEGTAGRTWHDAMEAMVDCYREGITMAEERSGLKRTPARRRRFSLNNCPYAVTVRIGAVLSLVGAVVAAVLWFL